MAATPIDRIDAAIARIEAASARNARDSHALALRHSALRTRMAEAVAALDEVIAKGNAGGHADEAADGSGDDHAA